LSPVKRTCRWRAKEVARRSWRIRRCSFEGAVGLGSAGAVERVSDAELVECRAEVGGTELAAVIGEHALELPPRRSEVGSDLAGEP